MLIIPRIAWYVKRKRKNKMKRFFRLLPRGGGAASERTLYIKK
nr:MAG TPA: hypothetical protein [Caudoviricetes sp.]